MKRSKNYTTGNITFEFNDDHLKIGYFNFHNVMPVKSLYFKMFLPYKRSKVYYSLYSCARVLQLGGIRLQFCHLNRQLALTYNFTLNIPLPEFDFYPNIEEASLNFFHDFLY